MIEKGIGCGRDDQGAEYIGWTYADGSGNWKKYAAGQFANRVTATATGPNGNTSEFSSNYNTGTGGGPTVNCTLEGGEGGTVPIPVELLIFAGKYIGNNQVLLEWATATEMNNDYFEIERSSNNKQYDKIGKVNGADNSNTYKSYTLVDYNPEIGTNYYRLKQVDFNGSGRYAGLVLVTVNKETRGVVIYPNPAGRETVNIRLQGFEPREEVLVVLTNLYGKMLYSKVYITKNDGTNIIAIDPYNNIPPGIYMVNGSSENYLFSKRLVIKE